MDKKDEALKLSLKALEASLSAGTEEEDFAALDLMLDARKTIKSALADSALERMAENARELGLNYEPAQQQEPVALESVYETIIQWDEGGGKRSRRELARRIVDLYTSPPASKPWVNLTEQEIERVCAPLGAAMLSFTEVARVIETKLREKNA